jgi:glycosyltransferase involved in cell wall biosynthesis
MATCFPSGDSLTSDRDIAGHKRIAPPQPTEIKVALLTGGFDRPYAFELAMSLVQRGVHLDIIGSDEMESPEMHSTPNLNFFNLRGNPRRAANLAKKVGRVLVYYARLIRYAAIARPKIFHILWNNKFEFFDRTMLMLYYKFLGKRIVLTAHNVNAARRDSKDSALNRLTLRIQYSLTDHIFVHTEKMKSELVNDFAVRERAITVLAHPINTAFPDTSLTPAQAKRRLGLNNGERTVLFFGRIVPYKGLDCLVAAVQQILTKNTNLRLVIAGEPKKGSEGYLEDIRRMIKRDVNEGRILQKIQFIPDDAIELYFKAADVLALPYKAIFQSGVLFLAYSFGLPVVAADVGSFREAIIEGRTGFLCKSNDPGDLAGALEAFFESDLFKNLDHRRQEIRDYARAHHSWDTVGELTHSVYADLSGR